MKLSRLFFVLPILFVSFQICRAQQKPDVHLFDSFGWVNCEEIRGRSDNFLVALRNEPEAVGYTVFYGVEEPIRRSFYEGAFRSHVKSRRFPENRVKFINAESGSEFKTEFWLGRNGTKPPVEEKPPNLILTSKEERYLFAHDTVEPFESEGRLTFISYSDCAIEDGDFGLLAKYLEANPEMSAEILVYNKKASRAAKVIKLFLKEAKEVYQIPLERLKIRYAGIDEEYSGMPEKVSTVKIWLVPQQQQQQKGKKK